jgi:hypothetical protein
MIMTCEHLIKLEQELYDRGIAVTYRGQAWSDNCREWVYFDCYLNIPMIRKRLLLDACVSDHEHLGTHDGCEAGFVCTIHHDAIMGVHEKDSYGRTEIR